MRWTEQQLVDHLERKGVPAPLSLPDVSDRPFGLPDDALLGKGNMPKRGMNKLEASYAAHLDQLRAAGEVMFWKFESMKLRLGNNTWYIPDFFLLAGDGYFEVHETKGWWREDARVKIKVAADQWPFRFYGIQRDGKGWKREAFTR